MSRLSMSGAAVKIRLIPSGESSAYGVEGLGSAPWQAPSTPFLELSDPPEYEVRVAEVPGSGGVEVFYRREFASEVVDLIWVGRLPGS